MEQEHATNKIVILSPGKRCWKTRKIIAYIEDFSNAHGFNSEITIETSLKSFLKYRTWILPTVIINGKIIARGYKPSEKQLLEVLIK